MINVKLLQFCLKRFTVAPDRQNANVMIRKRLVLLLSFHCHLIRLVELDYTPINDCLVRTLADCTSMILEGDTLTKTEGGNSP
jgi:hypothetical protein